MAGGGVYRAYLTDGRSAERREVEIRVAGRDLVVEGPHGSQVGRRPVADLEPLEAVYPGQPLRLADRHHDDFHLTVPDASVLDELAAVSSRFRRVRKGSVSTASLVRWGVGAVGAVTALILALPHAAALATPLVPYSFEERFGGTVVEALVSSRTVCAEPGTDHPLQELARRLGQDLDGPGAGVKVRIVEGGPANAFAAPGGEVVFFEELIREAESSREVAGVLAHEMGHVVERHSMQHILRNTALSMVVSSVIGDVSAPAARAVDALATLSYSRSAEEEADDLAVEYLAARGYDSRGLVEFFERLAQDRSELEEGMNLLSTHPAPSARVERLRHRVSEGSPPLPEGALERMRTVCE